MITNNNLEGECSICQDNLGGSYSHAPVSLQCGHVFGRWCIATWSERSATCPECRQEFSSQELAMPANQELAMPESFIKRALSERTIAFPLYGLMAFSQYLDARYEYITGNVAITFIAAFTIPLLFLAHNTVIWCLSGRSNPLLTPRAKQLIGKQLHWVLDVTVGTLVGVAVAAFIKNIS